VAVLDSGVDDCCSRPQVQGCPQYEAELRLVVVLYCFAIGFSLLRFSKVQDIAVLVNVLIADKQLVKPDVLDATSRGSRDEPPQRVNDDAAAAAGRC
jgi:hypothetical protein